MARGWKPKPTDEDRLKGIAGETARIVRAYMGLRDVRHQQDVADGIGISRGTLSTRMTKGGFTQEELCKLIVFLRISNEDALKMLGVSAWRGF